MPRRYPADLKRVPEWSEDFSQRTLKEIVGLQEDNHAFQKELRRLSAALIESRLAKEIGPEEYALKRKTTMEQAEEAKRRKNVLADELWRRRSEQKQSFVTAR